MQGKMSAFASISPKFISPKFLESGYYGGREGSPTATLKSRAESVESTQKSAKYARQVQNLRGF